MFGQIFAKKQKPATLIVEEFPFVAPEKELCSLSYKLKFKVHLRKT